jgi:hypothetical protein
MWYFVVPFVLAFGYKLYRRDVQPLEPPPPPHKDTPNLLFVSSMLLSLGLRLMAVNVPAVHFQLAPIGAVLLAAAGTAMGGTRTEDVALLVCAVCAQLIAGFFSTEDMLWTRLVVFSGAIGTVPRGWRAGLLGVVAVLTYAVVLTLPGGEDLDWRHLLVTGTFAVWNVVAVVSAALALVPRRVNVCTMLLLYNAVNILRIPADAQLNGDPHTLGIFFTVVIGTYAHQWIVLRWIQDTGMACYGLGTLLQSLLFAMLAELPTETYILAWIALWIGCVAYSTLPQTDQLQPDREPSVPPLPPDSPKKPPREKEEPSAPQETSPKRATVVLPGDAV